MKINPVHGVAIYMPSFEKYIIYVIPVSQDLNYNCVFVCAANPCILHACTHLQYKGDRIES